MARERDINEIIGEGVNKFRDRVEENVGKFRDRVEENVDKVRDRVDDVRDRVEDVTDKTREKAEETWDDAIRFTKKHPAQAIGLAVVIGAAVGAILFGRRRD